MKKGKGKNSGLLPNSLKIISSCVKTVSTNASTVGRSAGTSVAASTSSSGDDRKDQVTWAGFDKLELGAVTFKHVLLLGYQNGFQVIDVDDTSNFSELVSKRDGPVTFLQMLPIPGNSDGQEGFRSLHPLLLVVAGDEDDKSSMGQNRRQLSGGTISDGTLESQSGNSHNSPTTVQFYSIISNCYVQVLRFRSAVFMVRCSPLIIAVGLDTLIHCIDALTLEIKFSVPTYHVPQFGGQGTVGVNTGYGPLAVGPRWLAYASDNSLVLNTGRLSPNNLTPTGISPSASPGNGTLMARYVVESSKQLASGIVNLGDMGYKTISRYCPELFPDGSNLPIPSNSGWRARLAASETDNGGMVVVSDVVSGAVISQFRAHLSPISALCFDPSGTLLVTASVHGNNINIFRIMPSRTCSGSNNRSYQWSTSHVHLYKLYRGITTAIIQDISFSHNSRWISIISSKGTCHIFVLSPFGGEAGFQTLNSLGEYPSLTPYLSLPWWSTSSFIMNQQTSPTSPPRPLTLSVVSRIKNNNSGLLNSISNGGSSGGRKVSVPSGAIAAVFHNSMPLSFQDAYRRKNSLEHMLVYTPSGYVIQHELLASIRIEPSEVGPKTRRGSYVHSQDEDLRIKVEPVQWWDVCRRLNSPEREERILLTTSDGQEIAEVVYNYRTDDSVGETKSVKSDLVKPFEGSHRFLSNAEVQINSGRLPIWQKSKIHFYVMSPEIVEGHAYGEFEIEKVLCQVVEVKRKDLLPVFEHIHNTQSGRDGRGISGRRYCNSSSLNPQQARDNVTAETVICHLKPASINSSESSDGVNIPTNKQEKPLATPSSEKQPEDMGLYFREDYCKVLEFDGYKSTEVLTDAVDSNAGHYDSNDIDCVMGGLFDSSEEG